MKELLLENIIDIKFKKNRHSVPLKNKPDRDDLRGDWAILEIEIEKKNDEKIDIFGFVNFVRHHIGVKLWHLIFKKPGKNLMATLLWRKRKASR